VAVGSGTRKVQCKASLARFSGQAIGRLFYNQAPTPGSTISQFAEVHNVPSSTPFTVTVTNRGMPDGVRLSNVAYHVKISDEAIAQLILPDAAVAACYDTLFATTPLEPGSRRSALFLRMLAGSTLDVGESQSVQIDVHCQDEGDAKITCHVHADIDASDLFPTSQNPNGEQTVSVIRGAL